MSLMKKIKEFFSSDLKPTTTVNFDLPAPHTPPLPPPASAIEFQYHQLAPYNAPRYNGRPIYEWSEEISSLKRAKEIDKALLLAQGCMQVMIEASQVNTDYVMEYYVIEVAKIQHQKKSYSDEISTIEKWLALDLPAPRQDYRLNLLKRRAKAQELLAKSQGQDFQPYYDEWKRLVELEKQESQRKKGAQTSSGRSLAENALYARHSTGQSRLIPTDDELLGETFCTVDFETANRASGASACQIALLRVINGRITDGFSTLLRPPVGLNHFEFTHLHGIGPRDVATAPTWPDVSERIANFVGGSPIYAHNAAFDSRVWRDLDDFYATHTLPLAFFCSYRTAQRHIPHLSDYKLPTVVSFCAPGYRLDHHRAYSDAEACALIVAELQRIVMRRRSLM